MTAINNNQIDGDRRVTIKHSVQGLLLGNESTEADDVHVTILDDDMAAWSLSVPASITEASGSATVTVDTGGVTFDDDQTIALTVSPNAASDLSGVPTQLTLPAEARTASTTIQVVDDDIVEDTETFTITASIGERELDSTQLTILDDDMAAWSLSVPASITEASGSATVTVDTGGVTFDDDQTIALTVSPNAASDLSGVPTQLTLPAEARTASTTIQVVDDDIVEDTETFTITASIGERELDSTQLTILDDDMAAWSLSVPASITEASGSATVTVDTGGVTFDDDQTIALTVSPNAASDLSGVPTQLTLPAEARTASTTIQVVDDDIVEDTETFTITASIGERELDSTQLTILDDDMAAWSLSVPASITEASGSATVTVDTGGVTFDDDQTIALTVSPNAASDLSGVPTQLTLPAEARTASTTIQVVDDDIVEDTETFTITASIGERELDSTQLTILDDDMAAWSLSVPASITEASGSATVTVDTGGVTFDDDQTIALTVSPNAASDLSGVPTQLTLPAEARTASTTIQVVDDDIVEDTETFTITASIGERELDSTQLTILDDDMAAWSLSVPASITEASGSATVTVDTGGVTFDDDQTIALTVSPNAASDLSGVPTQLTLPAEARTASTTIQVVDDDIVEDTETFTITASIGERELDSTQLTILDDDMAAWSLSVPASITEASGSATVTVDTGGVTFDDDQTIALTVSPNAASDLSGVPTQLTLPAEARTASTTIQVVDDDIVEDTETFTITASIGERELDSTQLTILDDDMAAWSLSVPASITEASGSATVTVDTGGVTFDDDQTIALTVSPNAASDLSGVPTQLTLPAEARTASTTIQVVDDDIVEDTETFTITASIGERELDSTQLTILDDDMAEIKVTEVVLMLSEGTPDSQGAVGTFSIELGSKPASPVTVTVRSSDVSAVTVTPTSPLRFTSRDWNIAQDVTVHAVEDSDADNETVTITYEVNGPGAYAGLVPDDDVMVMVQVIDDDVSQPERELVEDTVAAVAAATVSNVTSNIGARFSAPSTGGASVSLAGMPVVFRQSGFEDSTRTSFADSLDALDEDPWQSPTRSLTGDELLGSSSFEIALGAAEGSNSPDPGRQVTVWGRGDFQVFESGGGQKSGYDGDLVAGYLGADFNTGGSWLVGMALSRIKAEADYTLENAGGAGTLEAELTNLHPYARFGLDDRSEAWAILGLGKGEVTNTAQGASESKSDLSMHMMSAGARHLLNSFIGIDWALLGDGSLARVETSEGIEAVDGISASVWRVRAGVEASYTTVWEGGSSLTSFLEVAGRQDGGASAEGRGLELSPGLAFSDPESGFSVEARGRALVLHSADNHREYGASLTVSKAPDANGTGLSLAMTPTWGAPTNSLDSIDASLFPQNADDGRTDSLSLNSRVAYGFAAGPGILSPFAEFSVHDGDSHRTRVGSRYSLSPSVDLELSGDRMSSGLGDSEHSVQFRARLGF